MTRVAAASATLLALLAAGQAQAQTIIHNFSGLALPETSAASGGRYAPPDSNGVRSAFTTDSAFRAAAGISSGLIDQGLSDTRVKYDPTSQRRFAAEITTSNSNNSVLVAAPTTNGKAVFLQNTVAPAMDFAPQGITNYGTGDTGSNILAVSATDLNKVNLTAINDTAGAGATLGVTKNINVAFDGNGTPATASAARCSRSAASSTRPMPSTRPAAWPASMRFTG